MTRNRNQKCHLIEDPDCPTCAIAALKADVAALREAAARPGAPEEIANLSRRLSTHAQVLDDLHFDLRALRELVSALQIDIRCLGALVRLPPEARSYAPDPMIRAGLAEEAARRREEPPAPVPALAALPSPPQETTVGELVGSRVYVNGELRGTITRWEPSPPKPAYPYVWRTK
jgi:hypothetical protein